MAENKVTYGIKSVHYALATEGVGGVLTYGVPSPLPGAVSLNLTAKGSQSDFYADDRVYFTTTVNSGYDGTVTMANLTEAFRTGVLGDVLEDGVLTENANSRPKTVALLFEFDGDAKAVRHALYNVTMARPGLAGTTKTESAEPGTQELSFVAAPNVAGIVKRSTTAATTVPIYDAWYETVFAPTVV
jgi:phi13 family phage major tail protein